ncbi:MAG: hypothetical protein APR63_13985 [Desulfuromonas sp. SDB]|nr:MAG: hypothetical protein APR63_13985 [Desulfuromonas sp. SDB]
MDKQYEKIINFHGHSCPGLAIGYRMTLAAMKYLNLNMADDEELVAVVENDACGVDALQFLSGCTFGKGNLIFKDFGKPVYTFYDRKSQKAVRVYCNREKIPEQIRTNRSNYINWLLNLEHKDFLELQLVKMEEPQKAMIRNSLKCDYCGEYVMETRIKKIKHKNICLPCSVKLTIEN